MRAQVLTWAIGVLTTVLGAYLAGSHERAVAKGLSYEDLERNRGGGQEGDGQQEISMPMAFGFMVVASCMLVVLFFLHEYLSKAIVILYTLGSCGAMLHVLCTAVRGCAPSIGREMREVPLLGDVSGLSLMLVRSRARAHVRQPTTHPYKSGAMGRWAAGGRARQRQAQIGWGAGREARDGPAHARTVPAPPPMRVRVRSRRWRSARRWGGTCSARRRAPGCCRTS